MTKPSTCRFPALWKAPWPSCTASACVVRVPGLTIFICHTLLRVPHLRCTLMLLTVRPTLMHPLRSTTRVALSAFAPCRHLCPTTVPNPHRRSTERSWSVLQCWRHLPCPPPPIRWLPCIRGRTYRLQGTLVRAWSRRHPWAAQGLCVPVGGARAALCLQLLPLERRLCGSVSG